MPPEPGSPAAWLQFARSDLALSRQADTPDVLRESLCFHAQQAAEKSIKAVLIHSGIEFPKMHSIERLFGLLPADVPRPPEYTATARLTRYAIALRYPHGEEPITKGRYAEAVRLAEAVLAWAEECVESRSSE